ncbi:baseplate J/gp47 family protein [bacterium]|nr:baseplate J/gp47 family protein [bacterium]
MIDVVPNRKVVKINATIDDDINLILDAITKVDSAFIMLVLPEGNDLANSPIGLKALRKKTLEKAKHMVLVVPKGSGYELAKKAGFIASTSQEAVTGDVWQTVIQQFNEYKHTMAGMNSKKELPRHLESKVEYMAPVPEQFPVPEIITGGGKIVNEATEETHKEEHRRPSHKNSEEPKIIEKEDDKKPTDLEKIASHKITGMDFSKLTKPEAKFSWFRKPKPAPMSANTIIHPQEINSFHPDVMPKKVGDTIAKVNKKKETSAVVRFLLLALVGGLVTLAGVFTVYYYYFPRIRIELQIQSNSISLTDSVLATSAVTGFDVNRKEIQMTKEKVEKNAAQSFTATEKGQEGEKAVGTVSLSTASATSVPVGTKVTVKSKNYVVSAVTSMPVGVTSVPITAVDIGSDYNFPTCALPAACDITIDKSGVSPIGNDAIAGGTKREFMVVSQKDVDKVTKDLQTELSRQAESDLAYMNLDKGYTFIKESVKTEIKDKVTVKPSVGSEVKEDEEEPSIAMFTNTTALYYHSESLTKLAERLLLDKYKVDKSLSAEDAATTSIEQLTVKVDKITVEKDDKVTINFSVSGLATSRLDSEKIRRDVAGKKWPEMLEYLSKLPALLRAPEVKFFPSWLPDFARYVPKESSRIDVGIKVVPPEVTPTDTP